MEAISSMEEEVSSSEEACFEAESDRISDVAADCPTASPIFRRMVSTARARSPISSFVSSWISRVRSPSAISWMTPTVCGAGG